MDKEEMRKAIKRHQLEDSLRQEYLGTISDRITRYLELDFIKVTPNTYFASISAECMLLYRDGYFFACIALCQAVAEAIVRLLCTKSRFKPHKVFEKNVDTLRKRKIEPDCSESLEEIWKGRDDYHHLNPKVTTERIKLQAIAKNKMIALSTVESRVFEFQVIDGAIKPRYPKYWPQIRNGLLNVFLRFEP